ncbi:MAG: Cadmium, cobalt and zinc/H(+)-K(+) antiporter [Gammaproteobacteria bacterium]|nr:Cadmium, cobalt and zinc/H(+)-K(+) antiporter [Gammaproteobacteria bacterium]
MPKPSSHHSHQHAGDQAAGRGVCGHDAHVHAPRDFGTAFVIGIALNLTFVVVEGVFGWLANSIALVADAGHNLSDVLGLAAAWTATLLARRRPSVTHTYGLRRGTVLAALINAVLLLMAVGAIVFEALRRLVEPGDVASLTVMVVAAIGVVINGVTAWLFAAGRAHDINVRGAFLHMTYDALISLGVVAAGAAIMVTGWMWLDPAVSLAIAAVIVMGTWGLLRESVGMSLDAVPSNLSLDDVRKFLLQQTGVSEVHDLHVWSLSTTETALTCHCVMQDGHPGDAFLVTVAQELRTRFGIQHATIQIEVHPDVPCALEPDHVV